MLTDKPLHVQVAEALGWAECDDLMAGFPEDLPRWQGVPPSQHGTLMRYPILGGEGTRFWPVPRYDTDWSATGPLIEKYGITALRGSEGWYALQWEDIPWVHEVPEDQLLVDGDLPLRPPFKTPLLAVCNLILALHQAGKLPQAPQNPPQDTQ